MPFTKQFKFPTEDELNVQEVNLSMSALKAGANYLGRYCEKENNEFMLCRSENYDPRKCLADGKVVTKCALKFFQQVKKHCATEFNKYANCLYKSSNTMQLRHCRNTQAMLEGCLYHNMGVRAPPFAHFAEVQVHKTDRPKPPRKVDYYPDAADSYPHEEITPEEPRFGSRQFSKS